MTFTATALRPLLCVAGVALGLLAAAPALAEGTAEQRMACMGDAMRLCSADIPNVSKITACLRRERAQVSAACQTVMRQGETMEVASNASPRRAVR